MSWDLYAVRPDPYEQARKRRFEESVQDYIAQTPEQRAAHKEKLNALFADYKSSPVNSEKGLLYYEGLLSRLAVLEAVEERLKALEVE